MSGFSLFEIGKRKPLRFPPVGRDAPEPSLPVAKTMRSSGVQVASKLRIRRLHINCGAPPASATRLISPLDYRLLYWAGVRTQAPLGQALPDGQFIANS